MATITSSGIGSGLDIAGLVQQLVAAEGQPAQFRIAQQEARLQAKLSAFGSLKSSLSTFNDQLQKMNTLDTLLARKVSSENETVLTATVDATALPASYEFDVQDIALAHKLQSDAFAASTTVVGTGTLSIVVGTDSFDIVIDANNNTLEGIADAINDALDNTGVSASIFTADDGSHLSLTSTSTGASNDITVSETGGDGGLSALVSLTEITKAQDAKVKIDGLTVTNDSNTITDAITGVTLNLLEADKGKKFQVTVENDKVAVVAQIDAFVNSYNQLIDTFDTLTTFNVEGNTATALFGDSVIRNVRDQLRRELSIAVTDIAATFNTLTEIGIETDIDGKLSVDATTLDSFLTTDFSKVGQLFANSDGFAVRLSTVVDNYLDEDDGIIAARTEGVDTTIDDFADQREALNRRLASLEVRLLRQFNALDALIAQLTTTSNFLTQQLANLPGISISNN